MADVFCSPAVVELGAGEVDARGSGVRVFIAVVVVVGVEVVEGAWVLPLLFLRLRLLIKATVWEAMAREVERSAGEMVSVIGSTE